MLQVNLFTKQKQTHRLRNELMITSGEGRVGVGKVSEFRIGMYTLLYLNLKASSLFCIARKTLLVIIKYLNGKII